MSTGRAMSTIVYVASDHGALDLKQHIVNYLKSTNTHVVDLGTHSTASVDYPDYASLLARSILAPTSPSQMVYGIGLCGTGIGISIALNKIPGIRAALCHDHYTAKMAREHNNANVLCLGGRVVGVEVAKECIDVFLQDGFLGGRHQQRLDKIVQLEKESVMANTM